MKLKHIVTPPIREFLLRKNIHKQFLTNIDLSDLTLPCSCITGAFFWWDTPEGTDYWWAICKEYANETETHSDT